MREDFRRGDKVVTIEDTHYESFGSKIVVPKGERAIILWSKPSLSSATIRLIGEFDVGREFEVYYSQIKKEVGND